ncbi:ABC transporter substrate-binding protein [Variovorax sp. OV329]|uniref:ABC transporter substrate-binding protein n=1 Tax=Variovorax sp. OV329 TaxID=1882825 RepID=UPI0008DED0AC|nr:ABC transporter substrate-binding protein [Variovorax sp. OV329]SFN21149.1 sulfonate transport system substrate-binding protein [Variovorax sp. OV329]
MTRHSFSIARRPLLAASLAFAGLLASGASQAADLPQVIRLAAPEQGSAGKSFLGAGPASLAYASKALEAEFEKDGIKVEWKFFKGAGPAINEALATGQLDVVFLGDLAGVIGRASGLKTRLVSAGGRGSNSYLATALGSNIQSFKDLKGKRVAVLRGTAYQLTFNRLLEDQGLTEKDVRFTNLDWPTSKAAVVSKDIDATFGGSDLQLLKLAGTADIPVSTRGKGPIYGINSGTIVTDDFAKKYPQLVTRLVKVLVQQAHAASLDEGKRGALFNRFHEISGLPVALFASDFEGTLIKERYSPLLDSGFVSHYADVIDGARKVGIIRQTFDAQAWADPSFLNAALKELRLESFWTPTNAAGLVAQR